MPDRLLLTQNAQFYIPKSILDNTIINTVLDAASRNIEDDANFVLNEIRQQRSIYEDNFTYKYSVRVFPSQRPVYFLEGEEYNDRVYAFILIFEIDDYVVIIKQSCTNITDTLELNFNRVTHIRLASTFDDEDVEFQKISLRNMTISEKALRSRSYEAADLKGLLSTHAAGRSIPFYLKIRQHGHLKTITANSGRMVESSTRKNIDSVALWIKHQIDLISNPSTNKGFLNSFAKSVELSDVLALTKPCAILVESLALHDRIESDGLPIKYKTRKGIIKNVSNRIVQKLFSQLEKVHELDEDGKVQGIPHSFIKLNEKSITLRSLPLRRLRVEVNGRNVTLQSFIIRNGFYSVCFNDPKYMYFMNSCFEDSSGISEIDSLLEILVSKSELVTVQSEKGTIRNNSSSFESTSIFHVVEEIHQIDDYIFCDDLGIEWADHISMNKKESCINFMHSKYGTQSTSASSLHEVVGQGIKNLGNMFFSKKMFLDKYNNKLSGLYPNSQIQRTRKRELVDFEDYLTNLLRDYKLHRKCILCCSFLSKNQIRASFMDIKNGKPVRGHIIQFLWIISSFAHATKDMNIIPIIYCAD